MSIKLFIFAKDKSLNQFVMITELAMKRLSVLVALAALLLGATSCGDGKYVVADDVVYFTYWTFSFGQMNDTLPDADPATFKAVKDWLGRDAQHVYFKGRLVHGADPATIKVKKYPISFDNHDYYYEDGALHVADMESFKILETKYNLWAKDNRQAYYDSTRLQVDDINAFHMVSWCYATDNHHIYYFGKRIEGADPATFVDLECGYYKDKNHVWYVGDIIEDADASSFKVDKDGNASDKLGPIYRGKRTTDSIQ